MNFSLFLSQINLLLKSKIVHQSTLLALIQILLALVFILFLMSAEDMYFNTDGEHTETVLIWKFNVLDFLNHIDI